MNIYKINAYKNALIHESWCWKNIFILEIGSYMQSTKILVLRSDIKVNNFENKIAKMYFQTLVV